MSFFNKKEEVIDLQLTQYGKQLLSLGKFKPVYYAFFDNNILYDSSYSGVSGELLTAIEGRIQDETSYNKTQYVFSGRETAVNAFVEANRNRLANEPDSAILSFTNPAEAAYTQVLPLGNSDLGTQKAPNFSVVFFNGELSGSVATSYSSSYSIQRIPQLNATIKFTIKPIDVSKAGIETNKIKYSVPSKFDGSDTAFQITEDYLLFQLMENNTEFEKENFEILPFLVETVTGSTVSTAIGSSYEQLIPLPFQKINPSFLNLSPWDPKPEKLPEFIDHYFEILADDEIPEELICESISRMKKMDYMLDDDFDCEDIKNVPSPVNLYQSNIIDDDVEKCDI